MGRTPVFLVVLHLFSNIFPFSIMDDKPQSKVSFEHLNASMRTHDVQSIPQFPFFLSYSSSTDPSPRNKPPAVSLSRRIIVQSSPSLPECQSAQISPTPGLPGKSATIFSQSLVTLAIRARGVENLEMSVRTPPLDPAIQSRLILFEVERADPDLHGRCEIR